MLGLGLNHRSHWMFGSQITLDVWITDHIRVLGFGLDLRSHWMFGSEITLDVWITDHIGCLDHKSHGMLGLGLDHRSH